MSVDDVYMCAQFIHEKRIEAGASFSDLFGNVSVRQTRVDEGDGILKKKDSRTIDWRLRISHESEA